MFFDQANYDVRCEWGLQGVATLTSTSDAIIIVDVLSFSTCVDIACGRGALIYPYRWRDNSSVEYAQSLDAVMAGSRRDSGSYSLSPTTLLAISPGTRLVLPSPNGSTLTLSTGDTPTFAGCLRNAGAVAKAATSLGARISVIPAGERWQDGTLRPAIEDMLGAGAIIHNLPGSRSSEAAVAEAAFLYFKDALPDLLRQCSSGRELVERGFASDVDLAAALNVSDCAPRLVEGAYMG